MAEGADDYLDIREPDLSESAAAVVRMQVLQLLRG